MNTQATHSLWIVEDDAFFRESLEELINLEPNLALVLSASSVEEALAQADNVKTPEIILHDIGLPGMSGIEAIPVYKEKYPSVHIIMLTIFEEDERVFDAIKAGADGYLLKRTPGKELLSGIEEVLNGGAPISPGIARKVMNMLAMGGPKKQSNLTERELDILSLLVKGFSMDMVSGKLSISTHTVDTHIKNIYKKLQVHSRGEVVAKAIKERII